MKKIALSGKLGTGLFALVDDDDFDLVETYRWYVNEKGYAISRHIRMSRLIMGFPKGQVDHRNRNKLDNQKLNLRTCTNGQNQINQPPDKTNTSGFKGVFWHKQSKKWAAQIHHDNRHVSLGLHEDANAAARAYDEAALALHGEFAWLNFSKD
jgi:hypothetical protein